MEDHVSRHADRCCHFLLQVPELFRAYPETYLFIYLLFFYKFYITRRAYVTVNQEKYSCVKHIRRCGSTANPCVFLRSLVRICFNLGATPLRDSPSPESEALDVLVSNLRLDYEKLQLVIAPLVVQMLKVAV